MCLLTGSPTNLFLNVFNSSDLGASIRPSCRVMGEAEHGGGVTKKKIGTWFCYFKLSSNLCKYLTILPEGKAIELHIWTAG